MTTAEQSKVGLPTAKATELGFSAERLARIGPAMQSFIDAGEIPGYVALIARRGRVAHIEARGSTHFNGSVPLREDTIFRIASATKPIASVALLMLHEEGRFLLDEPISRFLPAFKGMQFNITTAAREVSIRDCLTHTVGFGALTNPGGLTPQVEEPVSETLARVAKLPLSFQPGEQWQYNAGISVVGHLVEVISGMNLGEFMRERIFEPLGMPDSSFYLPKEKLGRFVPAYQSVETASGWEVQLVENAEDSVKVNGPHVRFDGSAGLLSTIPDYSRFAQMLLNGGELDGVRILGRKTVELMTTNHTGDLYVYLMGKGYGYGLGVSVRTDLGGTPIVGSVGSFGWPGAWGIWNQVDPREQMVTLFFTQVNGYWQRKQDRLSRRGEALRWIEQFESLAHQALAD